MTEPSSGLRPVLIVTYYWPPSGGSGVQRWLKFVKYLPDMGWQPVVFTPENPATPVKDDSLLSDVPAEAEVIHFPIWEPYRMMGSKGGRNAAEVVKRSRRTVRERFLTWVRANLIVPDPRRFWVSPSARFLADLISRQPVQTIITTGPPHSVHLIGLKLKKKMPELNWIADFRDPWSEWGFLDSLGVGGWARSRHRKLERAVLRRADTVVTITPFYQRQFLRLGGRPVSLITNGYDESDFADYRWERTGQFIIRHIGAVNEKCDPRPFLRVLERVAHEYPAFGGCVAMEFVGEVHADLKDFVAHSSGLRSIVRFTPSIPHRALLQLYRSSVLHLLVLEGYKDAEGYLPGKLFEYMATGLPILGVGPAAGDAAQVLNTTGLGVMLEAADEKGIQSALLRVFQQWQDKAWRPAGRRVTGYSRKELTGALVKLLR